MPIKSPFETIAPTPGFYDEFGKIDRAAFERIEYRTPIAPQIEMRSGELHLGEMLCGMSQRVSMHEIHQRSKIDVMELVKERMSRQIGRFVLDDIAEMEVCFHEHSMEYTVSARWYAFKPQVMKELMGKVGDTLRFATPPPPAFHDESIVRHISNVPDNVTESMMDVWQTAYDVAMFSETDTVAPEKRALQAVLDYIREQTPEGT